MKTKILPLFFMVFILSQGFAQNQDAAPITVQIDTGGKEWIAHNEKVVLILSRPFQPGEGKIGVMVGATDFSNLFRSVAVGLEYRPEIVDWPTGEQELIVSLINPDGNWNEIGRFPIKVLTRDGFQRKSISPKLDLGIKSQLKENHSPDSNKPPRSTFNDFTMQWNFASEFQRPGFIFRNQFNMVGTSYLNETLRFAEKGDDAPYIDLSQYALVFEGKSSRFTLGHVNYGSHRYLLNGFISRGTVIDFGYNRRINFSATAINGTNIVGWNNIIGLNDTDHQIYSGTMGVELLQRPGGLRMEASYLHSSVLPLSNFNQGIINDAEKSRGLGLRFLSSSPTQRWTIDAGYARSSFTNPNDPMLSQGLSLVPVVEEERDARYLEAGFNLLNNVVFGKNRTARIGLNYKHENVDPLFRTAGNTTRADFQIHTYEAVANVSDVAILLTHSRSKDNLDNIPSILKTKTNRNAFNAAVPFLSLFGNREKPSALFPIFAYVFDHTHQFGASVPVNSGFNESHVPDQINRLHTANLSWQSSSLRTGYTFNHSFQDNRQTGRERADLKTSVHTLLFGLRPRPFLDVNLDTSFEEATNYESGRIDKTRRHGINLNLVTAKSSNLTVYLAITHSQNEAFTSENNSFQGDVQWNWNVKLFRNLQAQYFIRYSNRSSDSFDSIFNLTQDLDSWSVNTGLNLKFF